MEVNMNKVDSKNLKSCWFDVHLNPDNSEWLGQNSKGMPKYGNEYGKKIAMFRHEYGKKICDDTHHALSQLESAQEDISILKAQLDIERRQVVNLQEQIFSYRKDLSNRGREVEELKGALCDAQDNFSIQKASFQSEIFGLLENETLLEAKLKEWEVYGRDLEGKIRQSETEKMEIKDSYDVQENTLQGQISQLRAELNEKRNHVEALNKKLVPEARSRDLQIGQMEEHLQQLSREHQQMISGSKQAKNLEDELKLKINDLEKEVDRQRIMIFDVAEEKREVIRQLSFTLEHYKSGYKECQAFLKHKRHAVMA